MLWRSHGCSGDCRCGWFSLSFPQLRFLFFLFLYYVAFISRNPSSVSGCDSSVGVFDVIDGACRGLEELCMFILVLKFTMLSLC